MAGQRTLHLLITFVLGLLLAPCAVAQTPQPVPTQQSPTPGQGGRHWGRETDADHAPEFENARKAIEALTPEQRKRFQENFLRWMSLSPEEKKALREREDWRREVMSQEVEHALKQSGLVLEPARREMFAKRYAEERRAIEMQLRKDMEEKRRPLVQALIQRLKQEFSTSSASTTSTPTPTVPAVATPQPQP